MLQRFRIRYLDVLGSIYIYNEHRGYRSIDRIIRTARAAWPEETAFLAELEQHRRDERKHYLMFRRWFEARGRMPLAVDRTCGHIDRLVRLTFGCHVDDLDEAAIARDPALFAKLCRIIVLTEQRGMRQVDKLLHSPLIHGDARLHKIFKVIEADEPSHWAPYEAWLKRNRGGTPHLSERIADWFVHRTLLMVKLPALFLNPRVKRRAEWQDETDPPAALAA